MNRGISKRLRFEVFKRDGFKCQYCGKSPPEAILVLDHKEASVNGGTDHISNLITSCQDCNLGKGISDLNMPLPDTSSKQSNYNPMEHLYKIVTINIDVPGDWNNTRKQHGATWRDIIQLGIQSLTIKNGGPKDPAVSAHLKGAVESIMKAWNILKIEPDSKGNTP